MIRNAVEKDIPKIEDLLLQVCLVHHEGRPDIFKVGRKYSEDFWTEVFDYLSEIGWLDSDYNNPSYIVDNIGINGEIWEKDECIKNYDEIIDNYDGDVDEWINDKGYLVFDDYVVINLGL